MCFRRRKDLTAIEIFQAADELLPLGTAPVEISTVMRGRLIHTQTGYSWWDSLLLASALDLGWSHFLSEDLQDGQVIDGLTIVDPFAHSPADILNS